jgi:Nsp1-like C-terminal region
MLLHQNRPRRQAQVSMFRLSHLISFAFPRFSATSGPTLVAPTTTQSAGPSVPAPSMLRGKTVEDIVNRWTTELETHTREFSHLASEVAVWDRTLIENGNYVWSYLHRNLCFIHNFV